MTILEVQKHAQENKLDSVRFKYQTKNKREHYGCLYFVKDKDQYLVETYGISGVHTVEDFHAAKNSIEIVNDEIVPAVLVNDNMSDNFFTHIIKEVINDVQADIEKDPDASEGEQEESAVVIQGEQKEEENSVVIE